MVAATSADAVLQSGRLPRGRRRERGSAATRIA